jgi:hypothetical protein
MQNQSSLWLDIRRDRLDWIYLQGWGAMNPTAIKEAIKIGFPMNRMVGVWWKLHTLLDLRGKTFPNRYPSELRGRTLLHPPLHDKKMYRVCCSGIHSSIET